MAKKSLISRRNFLKSGSILSVGTVLAADPSIKFLAEALGIEISKFTAETFSCELFRPTDLLQLKFFFIHAQRDNNDFVSRLDARPLFVYCQIPPQHIGEQLIDEFKGRDALTAAIKEDKKNAVKSFLSGHTWLAFKLLDSNEKGFYLTQENLLHWEKNFELVTLDSFAKKTDEPIPGDETKVNSTFTGYDLEDIKVQHKKFNLKQNALFYNKAKVNNPDNWPLTTFQVPYKLFLSPIANPNDKNQRIFGEHVFKNKNDLIRLLPSSFKQKDLQFYKPWSNELIFKTADHKELTPRFKVVHYDCQDEYDDGVKLLPYPIHRFELRGLTMIPEPARDVLSEMFLLSSTGATTNLHYKNDNPTILNPTKANYSIVAWDQKIAEARDNYVSITFRAIDVFTGIKLHVSILAERTYKDGLSFLPQLYYVSFAEKEKSYQSPITVSKVPFIKVIPKTKGAYFKINEIGKKPDAVISQNPPTSILGYVVAKSTIPIGTNINCNELISFDYTGIDKDGNEHNFKSKMIFIPAESYKLISGTYNYKLNGKIVKEHKTKFETISLAHIGLLNPSKQDGVNMATEPECAKIPGEEYKYKMFGTFDKKADVDDLLDIIKKHVTDPTNVNCYEQTVLGEVAYASLERLKKGTGTPAETSVREIRTDSKAASFETDKLLLFSTSGDLVDKQDNYLKEFPLVPRLVHSNVVISQINQIEGKNVYRQVEFAEDYIGHQLEIDEPNPANKVKLLFKLKDQPQNFFSKNYKSAGAMVNPGIDITYVSILDQGITYNQTHNKELALPKNAAITSAKSFPSASIFQNLDAKILGIPLIAIIEDVLPVADLPVFSYLKDAQDKVNEIKSVVESYQAEFEGYKEIYDTNVARIIKLKDDLKRFERIIKLMSKDPLKVWFEDIFLALGAKDLYEAQLKALSDPASKILYENYYSNVLAKVKESTHDLLNKIDTDKFVELILLGRAKYIEANIPDKDKSIKELYSKLETIKLTPDGIPTKEELSKYLKESAKIYAIKQIQTAIASNNNTMQQAIVLATSISKEVEEKFVVYHNAVIEGLQEAALFAKTHILSIQSTVQTTYDQKRRIIDAEINTLLAKLNLDNILEYILIYSQLTKAYDNYKQLATQLKTKYYEELWVNKLKRGAFPAADFKAIEGLLITNLKAKVLLLNIPDNAPELLKKLKEAYGTIPNKQDINAFGEALQLPLQAAISDFNTILKQVGAAFDLQMTEINKVKAELRDLENKVKNYAQDIIEDFVKKIKEQEQELIKHLKGSKEYDEAAKAIGKFQQMLKKLREFSKQSLDYKYKTKQFKSATLGVIEFLPTSNTELDVKVKYEIEFDINLDKAPSVKKQSYITDSSLTDFKIGLMQFIYIDFERVKFITGSDVKDDFVVKIRDVQFAGMLSFVQAFQEYLKTINNNLVFDINSSGVSVGYGFAIPDFPAGYFNFFNLSFSGLLTLPFDPKKSLQFKFGLGSELCKFGITVCGIFGGQGYFNIIAETGRGIVGMELVLEFGAIYNLQLGVVANGTAYLVGGIYIRKYYDNFTLKGYILCVGRFNIIGLFSANLSFYLGLEYDGEVLQGVCHITASKRFSRFWEISVSVRMEKVISGAKKDKKNAEADKINQQLKDTAVIVEGTNLATNFYPQEQAYLILTIPAGYEDITTELISKINNKPKVESIKSTSYVETIENKVVHINLDSSTIKNQGEYVLVVKNNGVSIYEGDFSVVSPTLFQQKIDADITSVVDAENYYESYF